ncbi:MAG TPA: SIS domain-containing protein [Vicinamibacterales bacterium]|nr:SIS domain-containing protein [Vicinamibacterales bacterium]
MSGLLETASASHAGAESAVRQALIARNEIAQSFFSGQALGLARASSEMAARFLRGGRLLAFGRGPYASDAQHVAVEFVHPVIVGKRALPALDLSIEFAAWITAILRPEDIVMGFGPPAGDDAVTAVLRAAHRRGAMTFALPGEAGSYAVALTSRDPFVHQELVEILYHTLWETVHVFLEHRELGHDVGAAAFLYPFLGQTTQDAEAIVEDVAVSILHKVDDDAALRKKVAEEQADAIAAAVQAIHARVTAGGKLILFGNGGSATDANDWTLDCVHPPKTYRSIPAISLASEPATITAISNDVGLEVSFLRQLIAHARPEDVAIAISTSGGSKNVIAALEYARRHGLLTVGLLGYDGGEIVRRALVDMAIVVDSNYIPRIQEVQASIYHVMRDSEGAMSDGER